jgi:hypothetical protein
VGHGEGDNTLDACFSRVYGCKEKIKIKYVRGPFWLSVRRGAIGWMYKSIQISKSQWKLKSAVCNSPAEIVNLTPRKVRLWKETNRNWDIEALVLPHDRSLSCTTTVYIWSCCDILRLPAQSKPDYLHYCILPSSTGDR